MRRSWRVLSAASIRVLHVIVVVEDVVVVEVVVVLLSRESSSEVSSSSDELGEVFFPGWSGTLGVVVGVVGASVLLVARGALATTTAGVADARLDDAARALHAAVSKSCNTRSSCRARACSLANARLASSRSSCCRNLRAE